MAEWYHQHRLDWRWSLQWSAFSSTRDLGKVEMGERRIITIGFQLAISQVQHQSFDSKLLLLDWDIVLFRPVITDLSGVEDFSVRASCLGKPTLSDTSSFQVKESREHWRREIKQVLEAGKKERR